MARTLSASALSALALVETTGDALHVAGVDFRSAFISSALANDAARHGEKVPSSAVIAINKGRAALAGVPRYVSASSVDCHALAGAALSHGYDDETDPHALQSAIISAVSVVGMGTARKILRATHESAADALSALLLAVENFVPVETTDETGETTDDDETGETGEETGETASRISTGLALILDALNDGEEMTDDERATFLAIFEAATLADALAV